MGLLVLIAMALAVGGPEFKIEPFGAGAGATGTLVALDDQGARVNASVAIDDALGGEKAPSPASPPVIKISDVRCIGAAAKTPAKQAEAYTAADSHTKRPEPTVVLTTIDGSVLPCFGFETVKGVARLTLDSGESLEMPTKYLQRVEFRPDGKAAVWPELPKDAAGDLIVVQKKEAADLVEGVVGDVTADTVRFSLEGDIVPVKRAKVIGLVYFHSAQSSKARETKAIIEASDGWRIHATHVALVDHRLQVTTTFGVVLDRPLDSIVKIDFSPGRMVYLSDLPLESSEWTPFLDFGQNLGSSTEILAQFYKPRFDRAIDGGPLTIRGTQFPKGVAMVARTVLEYKIAGKGRRFRATAGIDDSVHDAGSVKLTIEGDGKTLYTGKITGRDPAVELNFDVSGVKRLRIVADFGGGADAGNYLDLGDARIVK